MASDMDKENSIENCLKVEDYSQDKLLTALSDLIAFDKNNSF